jgi:hypothetical protein
VGSSQATGVIFVVGKAVLTLHPPLRPLSHNINPQDGAQDIGTRRAAGGEEGRSGCAGAGLEVGRGQARRGISWIRGSPAELRECSGPGSWLACNWLAGLAAALVLYTLAARRLKRNVSCILGLGPSSSPFRAPGACAIQRKAQNWAPWRR